MNKRRFKPIWKLLLALAILVGAWFIYSTTRNYYYEKQLAEVIARLNAAEPGWQWEDRFEKLPKLSKEENAGEEIKAIMRLLALDEYRAILGRNAWGNEYDKYEADPGTEVVAAFLRDHPQALFAKENRSKIESILESKPCPEGLDRAWKLNRFQSGLFEHKYRPFVVMSLLPDIQSPRNLVRLLSWHAAVELEAHRPEQAAQDISTMLLVTRVFDHDPFPICTLVRSANVNQACHSTHRLLAQTSQPSTTLLKRLQEDFEQEESRMTSLPEVFRWERATYDHDLMQFHSGQLTLGDYVEQTQIMFVTRNTWYWPKWMDDVAKKAYPGLLLGFWATPNHFAKERADLLQYYNRLIAWSTMPEHQLLQGYRDKIETGLGLSPFVYRAFFVGQGTEEGFRKNPHSGAFKIAQAMLTYHAHCRCIIATLAAERYRLEHGNWPTSWEQLKQNTYDKALLDPFTGTPLIIKPLPDGLMIYSVGKNGIDDGGKIFPMDKQHNGDIGYRVWNPAQRRVDMGKEWKAIEEEFKGNSE